MQNCQFRTQHIITQKSRQWENIHAEVSLEILSLFKKKIVTYAHKTSG